MMILAQLQDIDTLLSTAPKSATCKHASLQRNFPVKSVAHRPTGRPTRRPRPAAASVCCERQTLVSEKVASGRKTTVREGGRKEDDDDDDENDDFGASKKRKKKLWFSIRRLHSRTMALVDVAVAAAAAAEILSPRCRISFPPLLLPLLLLLSPLPSPTSGQLSFLSGLWGGGRGAGESGERGGHQMTKQER